jgi:hypothetical protein
MGGSVSTAEAVADYCLLDYTKDNWFLHAAIMKPEDNKIARELLEKAFSSTHLHAAYPRHKVDGKCLPYP